MAGLECHITDGLLKQILDAISNCMLEELTLKYTKVEAWRAVRNISSET